LSEPLPLAAIEGDERDTVQPELLDCGIENAGPPAMTWSLN
jgi:hypothetical protein